MLFRSGLPVGSSGKVGLLLSGGIDSPIAGYLAQKRGCYLNCIYFHSPPHTSQKAKDKVFELAKKLLNYQSRIRIFTVNFTETQLMFKKPQEASVSQETAVEDLLLPFTFKKVILAHPSEKGATLPKDFPTFFSISK